MFSDTVFAMAAGGNAPAQGAQGAYGGFLFPMVVVILIFYFLIIRPQNKEKKRQQEMLENLKSGDKIVTIGGILGTVYSLTDKTVQIKVGEKAKITVLRSSIRGLQNDTLQE